MPHYTKTKPHDDTLYHLITDVNNDVVQIMFEQPNIAPMSVWVREGKGLTLIPEGKAIVIYIQPISMIDTVMRDIGFNGWDLYAR